MVGCARPTCDAAAVVGLGYDAVNRVAWLSSLDGDGTGVLALCERHAEGVTLPAGWVGRDDRSSQPTLWLPAAEQRCCAHDAEVVSLPVARRGTRRRVLDDGVVVEELPLWSDERHDPAAHLAEDLYGERRPGDGSVRGPEPGEPPRGPLLARAFRAAGLG